MSHKTLTSKSRQIFSNQTKIIGFINNLGESNCFLNSALQVLFHLKNFRTLIESFGSCQVSRDHYCLLCGLKEILSNYTKKSSQDRASPIDISRLRAKLAQNFESRNLFSISEPADSMEALSAVLSSLHEEDISCSACPAHELFQIQVEETMICECRAEKKEIWDSNTFFHHFYVSLLFEQDEERDRYALLKKKKLEDWEAIELSNLIRFENSLQSFIKKQWAETEYRACPRDCKIAKSRKILKLLRPPKVFSINLIWKDYKPILIQILQVLISIPYSLKLDSIYEVNCETVYNLKSVILYGHGHYICAIRVGTAKTWYKIDDEKGKIIGDGSWIKFVVDCLTSRYFPVGVFYEEAKEWEESGVSFQHWIDLEINLLNFMKNNEETKEDLDWICKCGNRNNSNWTFCTKCKLIKPGLSGWNCRVCTFYNDSEEHHCASCGERKVSENNKYRTEEVKKSAKPNDENDWKERSKYEAVKESKSIPSEKPSKHNESLCQCCQKPCICTKCPSCGMKMNKTCKRCVSDKKCYNCSKPLTLEKARLCAWCGSEVVSGKCNQCSDKEEKRACSACWEELTKCPKCGLFKKKNSGCMTLNCSYSNTQHLTFNLQQRKSESSSLNQSTKPLKCDLCESKITSSEEKYCEECFENQKKCKKCEGKTTICKSCIKSKEKCRDCGFPLEKGQKCKNSDCSSYTQESKPRSVKDSLKTCQICESELPSYGFCLLCKLKLKGDRCSFCSSDTCYKFCEKCIHYNKKCLTCEKTTHIQSEYCLTCK